MEEYLNNSGEKSFAKGLQRLLFELEPFNIGLYKKLASLTEKQLEKVKDKTIVLLLGPTGSGKSTSIQWLCGSTLVWTKVNNINHIGVAKNGY